jgi:Fe-S cluster assembly ATPase SufC
MMGDASSIWPTFFKVVRKTRCGAAIITTILVIFALAYMLFLQSLLMQSDLDAYANIAALGWYSMIERLLKAVNELIVAYFIMLPFKLAAEQCISEAIVSRSPSELLRMKENAHVLKNAALRALISLVENGLSVITPIVLLVSRSAALGTHLPAIQLVMLTLSLASVCLAGSAILVYDYRAKTGLSKKEAKNEERARSLLTSIGPLVVNGMAAVLPSWMLDLKRDDAIPSTRHDVVMAVLYGALEIVTTGAPVALIWKMKGDAAFLPLYIVIQPMFWNTWYLFLTVRSLVVSTAPWAQYAAFMDTSQLQPPLANLVVPDCAAKMMKVFENPYISEVVLIGPSGCGKTTLMKKIIAEISETFMLGFMLYIDQFASLPVGQDIYAYFASAFLNHHTSQPLPEHFKDELLKLANRLGIFNVINENTLYAPFSNPSGGEKKRIIFLKCVFPILMGVSNVMIAFLDEVSAGLDAESFTAVRLIIEEIKAMNVKVVSIDHHHHNGNNVLEVEVYKEIREIKIHRVHSPPKLLLFWQKAIVKIFPRAYHKNNKDDEPADLEIGENENENENETTFEIDVWAEPLGIQKSTIKPALPPLNPNE